MKLHGWKARWQALSLGVAGALAFPTLAWAQQDEPAVFEVVENVPATLTLVADHVAELSGLKPSSHWIGVVVRPCDDTIRAHLKLEGGLIVDDVTPDSPAAKSGIEKHDILLALNDASVADLKTLMNFLEQNKEKVIVVKILHAGEAKTVEITPAERPVDQFKFFPAEGFNVQLPEGRMPEEIERWMKEFAQNPQKLQAWRLEGEPFRARFFHPGVLLEANEAAELNPDAAKLPENLQVTVIKQGDQPAKITVKRGDQSWEITQDEIDKLPDDVRQHVKLYLQPADRLGIRVEPPKWTMPLEGAGPRVKVFAAPRQGEPVRVEAHAVRVAGPDIEKQLDEINGRLERIEKALEKLQ